MDGEGRGGCCRVWKKLRRHRVRNQKNHSLEINHFYWKLRSVIGISRTDIVPHANGEYTGYCLLQHFCRKVKVLDHGNKPCP